jgi:natural product precursor
MIMETLEKLLNELSEMQLNVNQMNRLRGGDGPTDPPDDPPMPGGGH